MREQSAAAELVRCCKVAALGTLDYGAPSASMVPYAIIEDHFAFIVLVRPCPPIPRKCSRTRASNYRPGTIKRDQRITMPRLRDPASLEFNELKRELEQLVMEEQQRHAQDECCWRQ